MARATLGVYAIATTDMLPAVVRLCLIPTVTIAKLSLDAQALAALMVCLMAGVVVYRRCRRIRMKA